MYNEGCLETIGQICLALVLVAVLIFAIVGIVHVVTLDSANEIEAGYKDGGSVEAIRYDIGP